jgi:hypothetical protein
MPSSAWPCFPIGASLDGLSILITGSQVRLRGKEFLSEHGVDICPLNETHLVSDQALRFANYVCYRTDCPTRG